MKYTTFLGLLVFAPFIAVGAYMILEELARPLWDPDYEP